MNENGCCCICLDEIKLDEENNIENNLKKTECCNNYMHSECIKNIMKCPLCRKEFYNFFKTKSNDLNTFIKNILIIILICSSADLIIVLIYYKIFNN